MTQKQLDFLTAIYKNDLTLKEIYKKANICYEDFLEITRTKDFFDIYVVVYEGINLDDTLFGLTNAGIEAVENYLFNVKKNKFHKTTTILALVISLLSLAVSIYSLYSQHNLELKLSEVQTAVFLKDCSCVQAPLFSYRCDRELFQQ